MQLNYSFKILLVCYVTPLPALTWSSLWLLLCLRKDPFKPFAEIAFASVSRDLPSLVPAASPASPDQAWHTAVDELWQVGGHGRATKTPTCTEHSDSLSPTCCWLVGSL